MHKTKIVLIAVVAIVLGGVFVYFFGLIRERNGGFSVSKSESIHKTENSPVSMSEKRGVLLEGGNALSDFLKDETREFLFENKKDQELLFILNWILGTYDFDILTPDGEKLNGIEYTRYQKRLEISDAKAGKYTIQITGKSDGEEKGMHFSGYNVALDILSYDPEDDDADGILEKSDNCPVTKNADQVDMDSDGVGDVCDNCPTMANFFQEDIFPLDGPEGAGNGIGDACEAIPDDIDEDGIVNGLDNCPTIPNLDQKNADNDKYGDLCDVTY